MRYGRIGPYRPVDPKVERERRWKRCEDIAHHMLTDQGWKTDAPSFNRRKEFIAKRLFSGKSVPVDWFKLPG